jgi:YrbI family 3-deoxy-D-manno-octulosonate 8-phosphate phosphatase
MKKVDESIIEKAKQIKLVLTDNDGVLTDAGVYYSEKGEELKRFNIRDGMGVERLKNIAKVETGIISGELSTSVEKRAQKLGIRELHLGISKKTNILENILNQKEIAEENIAYIGDDVNDLDIMKRVGLTACPADALFMIRDFVDYICEKEGGQGAFRELAELIIFAKQNS